MSNWNIKQQIIRLRAVREGGRVKRGHALPHFSHYDNANHTYGALAILLLFHPNPSLALIQGLAFHDSAERWFGDLPATAKEGNPELREAYEAAESRALSILGLSPLLLEEERNWLKTIDTLELWLWCREEVEVGNQFVQEWRMNCERYLDERLEKGTCPGPLAQLYGELLRSPHVRLSDYFREVELSLRTAQLRDGPGEARG